jgi:hypothetical protein
VWGLRDDHSRAAYPKRTSGGSRPLASVLGRTVSFSRMAISQPQNLRTPPIEKLRPYGIRVSLPPGDPFRKLLGPEWQRLHWYPTPAERDAAMAEMSRRHEYSRAGDKPALIFQKIENLAESRGL